MRAERAEQFGAASAAPHPAAPAARAHGYGESVEVLVADHAPLVRKIAWQVFSRIARTSELDDLIQTGLIALIEASRHYEDRGSAFATYASTRIRGAMIDHLRRETEVGRTAMVAGKRIQTVLRDLEPHTLRPPTAAEMAAALAVQPS